MTRLKNKNGKIIENISFRFIICQRTLKFWNINYTYTLEYRSKFELKYDSFKTHAIRSRGIFLREVYITVLTELLNECSINRKKAAISKVQTSQVQLKVVPVCSN